MAFFQAGTTVYNRNAKQSVNVDPVALRQAVLEFDVSDGLIPSDKIINAESFSIGVQTLGNSPELSQGYNTAPMFSYLMKTQGADLSPFEKSSEQIAYEQAAQQHAQLVALAIDKGQDPAALGPAPLPTQFGYDPRANTPAPPEGSGTSSTSQPAEAGVQ